MSRKFVPITMTDFKKAIDKARLIDSDGEFEKYQSARIEKDLSKVNFDFENCDIEGFPPFEKISGFQMLWNGMPYLGICAGGDWESPVFFIIYWDGSELRGYVPKNGNVYNTDTKTAFGNDEIADLKNVVKRLKAKGITDPDELPDSFDVGDTLLKNFFDALAIQNDIMARIK